MGSEVMGQMLYLSHLFIHDKGAILKISLFCISNLLFYKKHMRKLLFWIGLLISITGFIAGQSTRIDSISSIVSPRYASALAGIKTLTQYGAIRSGQRGFSELEEIYLATLASENDHGKLKGVAITKFEGVANSLSMMGSAKSDNDGMPVKAYLSNGDVLPWGTGIIDNKLSRLKDEGVLLWSSVVFSLGVFMQILSRFLSAKSRRRRRIKRSMGTLPPSGFP